MIQAQVDLLEKAFSASDDCFEDLKERLSSKATKSMTHSNVETMLETEGRELLRCLFDDHLGLRKFAEQAAPVLRVVGEDGVQRDHHRDTERGLATVFGEVPVGRIGYGQRGCNSRFPLDATLNLPRDHFSFGLRKRVAIESARGSFDEVVAALARTTGSEVAKRQVEELARRAAMDFDGFYETRKALTAKDLLAASDILVLTLDGKGIVVREQDLRPATRKAAQKKRHKMTKRLSPGEKKYRKRMAMVAAVYTVDRHHRTAEEIAYGPESVGRRPRPRPEAKRVWASIEKDPEKVVREIFAEALRRDPNKVRKWVALSDGNETQLSLLEKLADEHGVQLTIVVDIIHVLEYLWDATTAFNPTASTKAEEWVTERLFHVLNGKASDVAGGMRRSATLRKLSDKDRLAVA